MHVVTGEEGGCEPEVKSECAEKLSRLRFAVTLSWRVKISKLSWRVTISKYTTTIPAAIAR